MVPQQIQSNKVFPFLTIAWVQGVVARLGLK